MNEKFGLAPGCLRNTFKAFDADKDGFISYDDMLHGLRLLSMEGSVGGEKLVEPDLLMAFVAAEEGQVNIDYSTFASHFEPFGIGKFDPFRPDKPLVGRKMQTL